MSMIMPNQLDTFSEIEEPNNLIFEAMKNYPKRFVGFCCVNPFFKQKAVKEIERGRLGTTLVTESKNKLSGIITDGDIRRLVASGRGFLELSAKDVMTTNPRTITQNSPTYDALNIMEQHQITVLPVINAGQEIMGILHLHDILGKGEFKFNGI